MRRLPPASAGRHFGLVFAFGVSVMLAGLAARTPRLPSPARQAAAQPAPSTTAEASPEPRSAAPEALADAPTVPPAEASPTAPLVGGLAYLAVGGGADPASTQISLARDLEEIAATFAGPGALLFAAGHGAEVVAVAEPPAGAPGGADAADAADLPGLLAAIFAASTQRDLRFVPVALEADAATPERFERLLAAALRQDGDPRPLLVLVASHGAAADRRDQVALSGWGGDLATPAGLAVHLDGAGARRPLLLVVAACHGGAFAELLFRDATPSHGPAAPLRCGLFASTWDLPSSGCDPDPARDHHQGYLRLLLRALRRRDGAGMPLPPAEIDFDGDGAISMLEAHARVAIDSTAFDVPTTSAERWLRAALATPGADEGAIEQGHAQGLAALATATSADPARTAADSTADSAADGDAAAAALAPLVATERAIIARLGAALRLTAPLAEADAAYAERDALVGEAEEAATAAEAEAERWRRRLAAALLARWPGLADPWRTDFAGTLARDGEAIALTIQAHPALAPWTQARAVAAAAVRLETRALIARAIAERLQRAVVTLRLAALAQRRGGEVWHVFERLRTCERTVPALR